MIHPSV